MWPWEHLAVGYLLYSLVVRATGRSRPRGPDVLAVGLGSQFPDLVDKPLGWGTTLLPSGTSLAHSLLFAVPVATLVVLVAARYRRSSIGIAFAVAYLAHIPSDVVYPLVLGDELRLGFVLWPLIPADPMPPTNVFARVGHLFTDFLAVVSTQAGLRFLFLEAFLLGVTLLVWHADGLPGLELVRPTPTDR
ncbi:metal-dependent hydrolase [Halomicroarcula sp. F13]|uniref:Metal-dependent hydrolase n=1 Tax=Haloarcula rubra TaxID=2487747 RepID=A0AAW4PS72_9EURY|nr:metal-dependent hydrolase [Halomicroarcula rubra]MBX0323137.1 metal-dependent hydrolase [Halomicroarcula rubra]